MLLTLNSSSSRKGYMATLKPIAVLSQSKSLFILISYLTCCVWAWPAQPEYRSRNEYYQNIGAYEPELQPSNYNQWNLAQEPMSYDPSEDYYQQDPSEQEALTILKEMYDTAPVWGQIVNQKPETELEELKAAERQRETEDRQKAAHQRQQQFDNDYKYYDNYRQEKRDNVRPSNIQEYPSTSHHEHQVSAAPAVTVAPAVPNATPKASSAPIQAHKGSSGQKEVPLLRPPTMAKAMNVHETDEPIITVAQRSSAVEKPSAYDTLRKYLTLEDALKKEAEKRRAPSSRVHKRAPSNGNKQIVADVDSLRGQLNDLKKSVV